jgi:hypothetical protein
MACVSSRNLSGLERRFHSNCFLWWCSQSFGRGLKKIPRGKTPGYLFVFVGTAEASPFPIPFIIESRQSGLRASITASWNSGRICLIAWSEQSGQVRLVNRVIESWRVGSIHREVPV